MFLLRDTGRAEEKIARMSSIVLALTAKEPTSLNFVEKLEWDLLGKKLGERKLAGDKTTKGGR